jgi:hypothetical protein
MTNLKLFNFLICIVFVTVANAQSLKPRFKKLMYVSYRPAELDNKKTVRMEMCMMFDENGYLHYTSNYFEGSYYKNLSFKGSMKDTTYKISDNIIADLNNIFNGTRKLREHMITDKSSGDFAGPLGFLSYTVDNNERDDFIVVRGYLDKQLSGILEEIFHLPHAKLIQQGKVYNNPTIEAMILKAQKSATYIPKIVAPPTVNMSF